MDEETGLYYYGARYYDPRTSVWLSTDPLQEKYPNISSYAYCALNPVKFIDPDGRKIDPASVDDVKSLKKDILKQNILIGMKKFLMEIGSQDINGNISFGQTDQDLYNELTYRQDQLSSAYNDVSTMENDVNKTFRLNKVAGSYAEISPSANDINKNLYVLNYIDGDIGNQIHEVAKHGAQISRGEIIYSVSNKNVTTSIANGFTHAGLELDAYRAQFSYTGKIQTYVSPMTGGKNHVMNTNFGLLGTSNQLNDAFDVTHHNQITEPWLRSITIGAIGNDRLYPTP